MFCAITGPNVSITVFENGSKIEEEFVVILLIFPAALPYEELGIPVLNISVRSPMSGLPEILWVFKSYTETVSGFRFRFVDPLYGSDFIGVL